MLKVLDKVSKTVAIDENRILLFGISAGSQFSLRFAQQYPEVTLAVAAHAAGGYDWPTEYVKPKFLITVGEDDNDDITRKEFAKEFTRLAKALKIDVQLEILPEVGHWQTAEQNQMSREYFSQALKE